MFVQQSNIIADSAKVGVRYIEALPPRVVYRASTVPFMDWEVQNKHEKNDIFWKKALNQNLQVENLGNLAAESTQVCAYKLEMKRAEV